MHSPILKFAVCMEWVMSTARIKAVFLKRFMTVFY